MRRRNWISGGLALTLISPWPGAAWPSRRGRGPEQDEFIGYHLVYEPIPGEGEVILIEDENWVEYAVRLWTWAPMAPLNSSKDFDRELQDNGSYLFPGKEGLNFFFPVYMAGYGENEHEVRLSYSQLELTRQSSQTETPEILTATQVRLLRSAPGGRPSGRKGRRQSTAGLPTMSFSGRTEPSTSPETATGMPERGEILGLGRSGFRPRNSMGRLIRSPAGAPGGLSGHPPYGDRHPPAVRRRP